MRVPGKNLMIDWSDKDDVIHLARMMGKGMTVYQVSGRSTYNICHTCNQVTLKDRLSDRSMGVLTFTVIART